MHKENTPDSEDAPPTVTQMVVGTSVVISIVLLLLLIAWPAARGLLSGANAAAWVQAIGSVAAIGAAVWLAHTQADRERKKRECEEYERRLRNTAIVLAAIGYIRYVSTGIQKDLTKTCGIVETPARTDVMAHRIEALRRFAERLDVAQLDNARITPRYFGVLEAVVALEVAYMESAQHALKAVNDVLQMCTRFSIDFGGAGIHTIREYTFLPEFQDI
ncbi:hypothetical protein [Giesbergeria anulus]|uniref:hypothetical protein n=1 Tax=Giesbergeria anulus TaxID=180197 RepID=UPI000B8182C6|nr:hypothetical protein [Giesbergeria anulus]